MLLLGLHIAGRRCITVLDSGSLFSMIVYLLVMRSTWCLRGGDGGLYSKGSSCGGPEGCTNEFESTVLDFFEGFGLNFSVVPPSWACIEDFGGDAGEKEPSEVDLAETAYCVYEHGE